MTSIFFKPLFRPLNAAALVASLLALSAFFLVQTAVPAQAATKTQVERITKAVNDALGASGVTVISVEDVKFMEGLFEVVVTHSGGKKIIYSNASGSHLILGDLVESKTMSNLTEAKMDQLNAIAFEKDLPLNLALKSVSGTGSRKIAVFEDPNCGYCKRFRRETLTRLQDVTVYTFVFPVLSQDSVDKAQKILCASDQSKMLDDWMLLNKTPSGDGKCQSPVAELVSLGRNLGVTGTPTVFFQDGTRASGAITASDLSRRIALASRR